MNKDYSSINKSISKINAQEIIFNQIKVINNVITSTITTVSKQFINHSQYRNKQRRKCRSAYFLFINMLTLN